VRLTRVHPLPVVDVQWAGAIDQSTRDTLVELYRPSTETYLRINLVLSVSGSAAGADGTSESLTSAVDRTILGVIRGLSDAVLVGAGSVRAEGYRVPKHSTLAVVTGSGDLTGHRIGAHETGRVVVVGPESARQLAARTMGDAGFIPVPDVDGRLDARALIMALHDSGYRSIVCEGGPGLAAQLLAAGEVDELCLTTSPTLTATTLPAFGTHAFEVRPLSLTQLLLDEEGALYARWTIEAPQATV
jgi:riboflavin biosynthesis pyrimidine reductase